MEGTVSLQTPTRWDFWSKTWPIQLDQMTSHEICMGSPSNSTSVESSLPHTAEKLRPKGGGDRRSRNLLPPTFPHRQSAPPSRQKMLSQQDAVCYPLQGSKAMPAPRGKERDSLHSHACRKVTIIQLQALKDAHAYTFVYCHLSLHLQSTHSSCVRLAEKDTENTHVISSCNLRH